MSEYGRILEPKEVTEKIEGHNDKFKNHEKRIGRLEAALGELCKTDPEKFKKVKAILEEPLR